MSQGCIAFTDSAMKFMFLLLAFGYVVKASPSLPVHPGGIGGLFKGPNSETIIKGPDGSIITSAAEGGEVATKLDTIIVEETPVVPVETVAVPVAEIKAEPATDLIGPSGRIATQGAHAVIAGPASTTISGPAVVAETVVKGPPITAIPVATAPVATLTAEVFPNAVATATASPRIFKSDLNAAILAAPAIISSTALPVVSVTSAPVAIPSIATATAAPPVLPSIATVTSAPEILSTASPPAIPLIATVTAAPEIISSAIPHATVTATPEIISSAALPSSASATATSPHAAASASTSPHISVASASSQPGSSATASVSHDGATATVESANGYPTVSVTPLPIISSTVAPQQLPYDQLAVDNKQIALNPALIPAVNIIPPEIAVTPRVPARLRPTPGTLLTTPGLSAVAGSNNIQREEEIASVTASSLSTLTPQEIAALQNRQILLNGQVQHQPHTYAVNPQELAILQNQQTLINNQIQENRLFTPTKDVSLASIQQQEILASELAKAGIDGSQLQLTNIPLSAVSRVPGRLINIDSSGAEDLGRYERGIEKKKNN